MGHCTLLYCSSIIAPCLEVEQPVLSPAADVNLLRGRGPKVLIQDVKKTLKLFFWVS